MTDCKYRDDTTIQPPEPNYDKSKIDQRIKNYTNQVRSKKRGDVTREAIARACEVTGVVVGENTELAKSTEHKQEQLDKKFNDFIAGSTKDGEVISARRDSVGILHDALGVRLDAWERKQTSFYEPTEELDKSLNEVIQPGTYRITKSLDGLPVTDFIGILTVRKLSDSTLVQELIGIQASDTDMVVRFIRTKKEKVWTTWQTDNKRILKEEPAPDAFKDDPEGTMYYVVAE